MEMIDFLVENFKICAANFVALLQIYISLKIHSLLKSVMLQKNCNLNWLNCSITQFLH